MEDFANGVVADTRHLECIDDLEHLLVIRLVQSCQ
jgi:hypothetical protein